LFLLAKDLKPCNSSFSKYISKWILFSCFYYEYIINFY
jgi:hypothetical protein